MLAMNFFGVALTAVYSFGGTLGLVKTWLPSTCLETASNWSPARTAICDKDTLVFPKEAVASMSASLSFKKIVLPLSGEILLNEGASVVPETSSDCPGMVYEFSSVKKHHWWKPSNWDMASPNLIVGVQDPPLYLVVPDADRVPCPQDDAVIPNGTSFRIILQGAPVVRTLTVNGQEMNSESFRSFVQSPEGRRVVEGDGVLSVEPDQDPTCTDPTGCVCSNADHEDNYFEICDSVGACPFTLCKDPIKPEGFCCPLCCSVANFEYLDGFQLTSLRQLFQDTMKEIQVSCFLSKRRAGLVEVVCVDNEDASNTLARKVVDETSLKARQDPSLRLSSVQVMHSVEWPTNGTNSTEYDVGLIVGLLLFFILLAAATAVGFYFYRKKRFPSFDFVRFDGRATKVEVELGTTPHEDLQPQDEPASSSSRRVFYNPVYAKEPPKAERMPDLRENPLYGVDDVDDK